MSDVSNLEVQIEAKLDRLCQNLDVVKDKQEEMAADVAKIKEAVYNPDNGLYARLRELETWKSTSTKMIWVLFTSMVGVATTLFLKLFKL